MRPIPMAGWAWLLLLGPAVAAEPAAEESGQDAAPPVAAVAPAASRVRIDLDASGELFAPTGPESAPVRQQVAVEARFAFVERADVSGRAGVVREYDEARAVIDVEDRPQEFVLPKDARRILVALEGTTPKPFLDDAFLSSDEAELLDTPFDPLLLDRLVPPDAVAVEATWRVPADAAAGMLAIDTVESGGLEATLKAVEGGVAQVRLTGILDGAVEGVPTHVTIEGECTLAAEAAATANGDPAWRLVSTQVAAVTIRERRQAGHVAPGFDVEARVSVARHPVADPPPRESDDGGGTPGRRRGVGRPGIVWHRGREAAYDLVYDARWRVVEDLPTGLVMRFVDRGALVAQCSLIALPRIDAQAPTTIPEVQRDLEHALAGQFGRFEHASESDRSDGVRIVRVVADGTAGDRPFRWIHYVLTDAAGRRAAATFMLETAAVKRFAAADRDLVDGLTLADDRGPAGEAPPPPADREARVPRETLAP